MDLGKFLQENIFYTPQKVKEINDGLRRQQQQHHPQLDAPARPFIPPVSNMGYGGAGALSPQTIQQGTVSNIQGTRSGDREVNVVQRGQRATLNGKPVIADGYGNWLDASDTSIPMGERSKSGKYKVGVDRSAPTAAPVQTSTPSTLSTLQPGDDIPTDQYPEGVPTPGSTPDPSTWRASGTDTSTSKREVVKDADEAMRIWARTHGKLADKVIQTQQRRQEINPDYQQAGYAAIMEVRQPNEVAYAPSQDLSGMTPAYTDPDGAVKGLTREGVEGFPVDIKTKGQWSQPGLEISPDGTVTSGGEIVKIPDQLGIAPQTLPPGFPEAQKDVQAFFSKELRKIKGK